MHKKTVRPWWLIAWVALSVNLAVAAEPIVLQSPVQQLTLLELYTSEGCSSCPPADRWLSRLKHDSRLWQHVIPIAFHVDYWDYLGWSDRFADPAYGQRQRRYAQTQSLSTVYTPGLVLSGQEWRGWFRRPKLNLSQGDDVGVLRIELNAEHAHAVFQPVQHNLMPLEIHVALLGFDLSSKVKAGENRGRQLQHDFVVLGYTTQSLGHQDGRYQTRLTLPKLQHKTPRKALAAWVSLAGDPQPIQAVGGWL